MSDLDDAYNEMKNIEMQNCIHEPIKYEGRVVCVKCWGEFALILKPRTFKPRRIEVEVEDYE